MVYGYIYKISFPNGKDYIGLTNRTIEQRWYEHNKCAKSGDTRCLYNALRKYNMVDTFQMIVIDTAETNEELCEKEIAHIEINNSHYKRGYGYNMTDGGDTTVGYEYTEKDREKMSKSQKKRFEDPEEREKMCDAKKKYYEDNPEAGKAHGDYIKKYYEDNPEERQKHSEAIKKYYEDPEARRKNSEAIKKYYKDNPEARRKNSETQKKYYKDNPEARRKKSDGKGKNKPFDVFEKNGTYIKSFNYQFEAMEYLQTTYDIKTIIRIGEVLRGTRKSSHGFTFKYKE